MMPQDDTDYKRLFAAVFLAAILLIGWQIKVEWPRRQQLAQHHSMQIKKRQDEQAMAAAQRGMKETAAEETAPRARAQRLSASKRIAVRSDRLHGSIALTGARIDDLTLAQYRETLDPESKEVLLLSPQGGDDAYFMQAGWLAADGKTKVPAADTVWRADRADLAPGKPVTLTWDNGEGQIYFTTIALDENYMFTLTQRMENKSAAGVSVAAYAFINRTYEESTQHYGILHEGPMGVLEGALEEIPYKTLREKSSKIFEQASGWLGITDKYWLTALVPAGEFKATFSHYEKAGKHRYQTDYLAAPVAVAANAGAEQRLRFFAGAKELQILDRYADGDAQAGAPPIPLFDRAVDFGVLYFLTKPLFLLLTFFFEHTSNFGVAILLLTIVVKLLMFPLANKSYHAMAQMRQLQPEIVNLRERHAGDHIKINQEMMALYKREKVNPASGCLPILIQLPVFFALYKVLFVTIEMRHAPFFGWLKDLSAPDPSNLFTLFGLVPWAAPHWLHLGLLPMLFCASMVVQMRQQPKPPDPVQAKVMAWMPYLFLFICAGFPAGLVLYWAWSNVLSIAQQHVITRQHQKMKHARAPKAAA